LALAGDGGDSQSTALPPVYALRVGRAETIANGPLEHAVVLVENGKITVVGEDLPIERGIPVLDHPDWVLMPGLVNCRSRAGLTAKADNGSNPEVVASRELYPKEPVYAELLEVGVTTLGLVPPGEGIPGQSVAVRPAGATPAEMILREPAYLYVQIRAETKSKKMLIDGFASADEHAEKVQKAKEKWEKEQEKSKKSNSKSKDEEKKGEEKGEEAKKEDKPEEPKKDDAKDKDKDAKKDEPAFVPPEPEPKVKPFLMLRDGSLGALIDITKAAEYLHALDALGDDAEKVRFSILCGLQDDIDLYEVAEKVGKAGGRMVLTPQVTLQPYTRRDRNLPAEFVAAGAKLALVPRSDSSVHVARWRLDVANLVRFGLERGAALRAITLEPAEVLGLADRIGSIEAGKDANLVLLDGDPLEPRSRIQMVILEGKNVYEYEAPGTGEEDA
jgi:hypothetical protein